MISLDFPKKAFTAFVFILVFCYSLAEERRENTGIIVTEVAMSFTETRLALENAIISQGLKIENLMQIHAMLERTAADFQAAESPYIDAQSFDFCSTALVHKMAALHPHNPSVCPLIIFFYSLKSAPETSYIVYRLPYFLNDDGSLRTAYQNLLQSIVDEAVSW
jgi:hypothetical protein